MIRFDWDPEKAIQNEGKHTVCFEEAATVFFDPLSASFDDPDHSLQESRYLIIGYSARERLLVVSYTERGEVIRIISARKATAYERKRHEEETGRNG
jgi:uncharacterized DUF497 family protein